MRNYQTTAICRGCRHEFKISFDESPDWRYLAIPMECPNCESSLEVQLKRGMIGKGVNTRTKMIKHSEKLMKLLGVTSMWRPRPYLR